MIRLVKVYPTEATYNARDGMMPAGVGRLPPQATCPEFSIRSNGAVSTKQIRTMHDFARHRRDIEVTCYCGHKAVLPYREVIARFSAEGWSISLGNAAGHFRCSECGSAPAYIGPIER